MSTRIGVDTGGTFTDVVGRNNATGAVRLLKTPSTPDDPGRAVLNGLREGADRGWWALGDISVVVHGTTVATNALLERRGARVAMITTRGFRDVLAIQRQNRPAMYDLRSRRPAPLVPRAARLEVSERTLATGAVETPIDPTEMDGVVDRLKQINPEAVIVGLLHSHTNPTNERAVGEALRLALPGVAVCLSHTTAGDQGEFERFSTAAANGYVQPVMQSYLANLEAGLRNIGVTAPMLVMKSSGGAATAAAVARRCIETALSGPAGGVRAVADLASRVAGGNLIAADMGGTSFDVAVVTAGRPHPAREASVGGLTLRVPMLDIHTIGAGGGSVAWVDAGGALRVGPESAGAAPGPACYGRGGTRPTVTDANLVLGRLAPGDSLAGDGLDLAAAREVIERALAEPLGVEIEAAAIGVLRVANAAMVAAIRKLTIERGVDPREYALCPYGGAGPLHAAELCEELGAPRVVVPAAPGVFSACGLLLSDLREDRFATVQAPLDVAGVVAIDKASRRLEPEAADGLRRDRFESSPRAARRAAALRYRGQSSSLEIELPPSGLTPTAEQLSNEFHTAHRKRFGFDRPRHAVEVVGVAVSVELALPGATAAGTIEPISAEAAERERPVWFVSGGSAKPMTARVADRRGLAPGRPVVGPAIITQADTTTVVPPRWSATPQAGGEMVLVWRPTGD
ncbi:MAG: hydantoinase/oxoprolinase family protein [Planctomycetota bacterium]